MSDAVTTIKVLLIDDEENSYLLIKRKLDQATEMSFAVEWASNYQDAMQVIVAQRHDIYLVDYHLGSRSGVELIKAAIGATSAPFIMITGETSGEIDAEAIKAGAEDFLAKDLLITPILERSIRYSLERKRTQRELVEARASRMRSEFLATTSHELRTPLNGVIGLASLLSETELTVEQRQYVDEIGRSGNLLLDMIKSILDLASIASRGIRLEVVPFDLDEIFAKEVNGLSGPPLKDGVVLTFDLAADVPRNLRGDAARIGQILRILVGNALKFTSTGKVAVTCSLEAPPSGDGRVVLRIVVKDTGIGISREGMRRLFQPFSQVDGSSTRRFGGAGLGLAIAKGLLDCMQGAIGVDSELGLGSSFWFTLPLEVQKQTKTTQAVSPVDEQTPQRSNATPLSILVVDDCELNQLLLQRMLGNLAIHAFVAANGLEAVQAVSAAPKQFAAIFMDLHMPIMDGLEAAKEVRKLSGERGLTPIIALTADAQDGTKQKCLDAGMNHYLTKPVTVTMLKSILRECGYGSSLPESRAS